VISERPALDRLRAVRSRKVDTLLVWKFRLLRPLD
jgi:hypothetical protein